MARHDIAELSRPHAETVSRMFAELKERRGAELEGARRVHLLDTTPLPAMSA